MLSRRMGCDGVDLTSARVMAAAGYGPCTHVRSSEFELRSKTCSEDQSRCFFQQQLREPVLAVDVIGSDLFC